MIFAFQILALAAGACFILGFLGKYIWPLDIFSHFQLQYSIVFSILSIFFIFHHIYWFAALTVVIVVISTYLVYSICNGSSATRSFEGRIPIKIISFNVWESRVDIKKLADYLMQSNPDVVVLLEITQSDFEILRKFMVGVTSSHFERGRNDASHIAVVSRIPTGSIEASHVFGTGRPSLKIKIKKDNQEYLVYGIHPVTPFRAYGAWVNQFVEFGHEIASQTLPVVVVGDFNMTPWSPYFKSLLQTSKLRDSRRGFGILSSWPRQLPSFLRIPIDHALISNSLVVTRSGVGPFFESDHKLLELEITSWAP